MWEDEITIGNEIVIDDYTQSKQRIATVKIYRKGDTLPRFSFEVPVSSQGSGVPIGSIIAWGVDSNPSYDGGEWLECDGSTFDTNKYKRLYEVLGTNKLPNYQGMFVRGAGSQSYAQVNGTAFDSNYATTLTMGKLTSTMHSSGNVGEIQGDSTRRNAWRVFTVQGEVSAVDFAATDVVTKMDGVDWYIHKVGGSYESSGIGLSQNHSGRPYSNYLGKGCIYHDYIFDGKPKHYRYRPVMSTFSTESGTIRYVSGLEEYTSDIEPDEGYVSEYYYGGATVGGNYL